MRPIDAIQAFNAAEFGKVVGDEGHAMAKTLATDQGVIFADPPASAREIRSDLSRDASIFFIEWQHLNRTGQKHAQAPHAFVHSRALKRAVPELVKSDGGDGETRALRNYFIRVVSYGRWLVAQHRDAGVCVEQVVHHSPRRRSL